MYQKTTFRLLFIWPMVCIWGFALSQPPRGPLITSPQILADKKVTFRYLAPSAKEVKLAGSGENIETEIIPYEVLWEIMTKAL